MYQITAFPKDFRPANWDYANPLTVEFDFDRASGNDLEVSFVDSDITGTLKIEPQNISTHSRPSKVPTNMSAVDILALVKLSPRDAGLLTWQDTVVQASQRQEQLSPILGVGVLSFHPIWDISYVASSRESLDLGHDLSYEVDAQTGDIKDKDNTPAHMDFGK